MLVGLNENYIIVFARHFSYGYNVFIYWITRSGACCTKPKSRTCV